MPYARPTLTQLRDQAVQDINAAEIVDQSGNVLVGLLQKAILRVLAYVQAGMAYLHYVFLDWIAHQAVPWTASGEYQAAWAALRGITAEAATPASGSVGWSTVPVAVTIAAGTLFTRADGAAFVSTAAVATVAGQPATVPLVASVPGSTGNCDAGTAFAPASPIWGVSAQPTATAAFTGGADAETAASLRTRMLAAWAAPPQGGDAADYVEWALAVPGVTRAWVAPNLAGSGTVTVWPMFDVTEAANNGFPQGSNGVAANETRDVAATGDQLTVANAIFVQQPVTALAYVNAPAPMPVNFVIANLGAGNTAPMQAAMTAALQDMFQRIANVGGAQAPLSRGGLPGIEPSDWYEALGAISGLTPFQVTTPASPVVPGVGELPVLGSIAFSS